MRFFTSIWREVKNVLVKNKNLAVERAKKMVEYQNPSTTVYRLLELLKKQSMFYKLVWE